MVFSSFYVRDAKMDNGTASRACQKKKQPLAVTVDTQWSSCSVPHVVGSRIKKSGHVIQYAQHGSEKYILSMQYGERAREMKFKWVDTN